jgi:hypothetical protein
MPNNTLNDWLWHTCLTKPGYNRVPKTMKAERITRALKGRWHGRYGSACCPAHANTNTPALSLSDGDNGRLLIRCFAGCRFPAVLNALQGLGIVDRCGALSPLGPSSSTDILHRREDEEFNAVKRASQALRLWKEAAPISGTLAEAYARARGITCTLPNTLRFHPECWHGPSAARLPAMIAWVDGCKRPAIHRTYLSYRLEP